MRVRHGLISESASDLVSKFPQHFSAPVNIRGLAESLGIRVREKDFNGSVSGAAIIEGNVRLISVCSSHSEHRKRFTIAHELGHLLLHGDLALNVDVKHVDVAVFFRDSSSSTGEDAREVEANRFAAEILMPKDLVSKELGKISAEDIDEEQIASELAERFDVSLQAMCIRLGTLGFY